jgi:gliding motility-associated-like protein
LCNGATTNLVSFSGAVSGTGFSWTNDNTSIGLAASGVGNIASFAAVNTGTTPVTARITVTPSAVGCPGLPQTFTITVNPTPNVAQPANQILCNGATTNLISFSGAVSGTGFNWTNDNTSIGLAASGNGNIAAFTAINLTNTPVTATITVTPSAAGCPGSPQVFTITINPTPNVEQPANQILCNGASTTLISFSGAVSGTGFSWTNNNTSIGLAASGNGNIAAFTAINLTNTAIIATITVTPAAAGCPGAAQTFTIIVNPTPNVAQPANQILCNGATTNAIAFTGAVSGSSFSWTNSNTSIGLAGSGNGDIPAFTAVNLTNAPITATITVSASAAGCSGTAQTFTITVKPTPNVAQPANQALCNGATTNAIAFIGAVSGSTFAWTNSNPSIGLAASGNGDIPAFTAINLTNVPVTATITVSPFAAGCPGTAQTFTITVNPTPNVAQPANQVLCNGATTNAIAFSGAVSGSSFSWTNSNPTIGLAASGNGDIPAFTAINLTNAPVTATITVTPFAVGCPGAAQTFAITVNPTPDVVQPTNQTLCNSTTTTAVNFSGAVSGTSFNWTNSNPSIGLAASGNGNIPAFMAVNLTNTAITATISIVPSAGGCTGLPKIFTITVNPGPNVAQPLNQTLCNGSVTNPINFTGAVAGTVFSWTNSDPSIGLAASGNGDIPTFTTVNTTTSPVTATITVSPFAIGCPGPPKSFTITVNPTPNVVQPSDQILCSGATSNAIVFTGAVSGSTFGWTNNNTSIGLAAAGNGDIPAFTAINLTNVPVTATITVTPSATGCPGLSQIFTITVNPTPNVAQPAYQALCNGATTNAIAFTGAVSGSTFAWTNSNTSIGLAASGNGDIPAFTAINLTNVPVTATITVTPSAAGCPGAAQIFTITVNPTPDVAQPANQVLCNGATTNAIAFTGAVSGSNFSWTNSNTSIGLAGSGNGGIPAFTAVNLTNVPVTATITVTPSAAGCPGAAQTFTITVNPTPNVAQPANQVLCNGATTNAITFTGAVSGSSFSWTNSNTSIGLAATGNGDIPAFTAVNLTNAPVTATITVMPSAAGCPGAAQIFAITVNPTPVLTQPTNQMLCNGTTTNAVNFAGSVNGSTYNWTNDNTSVGLAASGSGNIPAFTVINLTNAAITATITVTPAAAGCPGLPQTFTITVKPTPVLAPIASQTLCNGAATNPINFTGTVAATSFSWTNSNPLIGLAASGNGNIPTFTAVNPTNNQLTAIITATASAVGCQGASQTFTIAVNPTPDVAKPTDQILCNGASTNAIAFSGAVSATAYSWTNNNTSIGLVVAGNGAIASFTAINTTNIPAIAVIEVAPLAAGCPGTPKTFTITVNPTPDVVKPADQILCHGEITKQILFAGTVAGTSFSWTNSNTAIGLQASGSGNITSFTALNPGSVAISALINVTPFAKGCAGPPQVFTIRVTPAPAVSLGADLNLSTGTLVTLNAAIQNGPITNWLWIPSTGLSCSNCPAPVLKVSNNASYTVIVTNQYGCKASDDIIISTFCENAQVFIPNAFTPDGDGLNDILMVRGKGISVKSFRIFNRWGELVFEKTNFSPNDIKYGWDGKVRGVPASPDVFVYTTEVICDNGTVYTYKGNSTLLK